MTYNSPIIVSDVDQKKIVDSFRKELCTLLSVYLQSSSRHVIQWHQLTVAIANIRNDISCITEHKRLVLDGANLRLLQRYGFILDRLYQYHFSGAKRQRNLLNLRVVASVAPFPINNVA